MARRGSETAVLVETAEHKGDHSIAGECFGLAQEMESRETPVDAAEAEVLGEMVF